MSKTGIIFFPAFDWSLGPTHPEREERLLYTQEQLFEEGVLDLPQVKQYSPELGSLHDVLRTQALYPDPDKHRELEPHLIAVGSSIVLARAMMNRELKNGFALVRPPGHHSFSTVWGNRGFCTLNNEAIVVNYLRTYHGIKKVAIIDTDVHHGDGTQDIFRDDPNVLCISIHQDGRTLYPGSGFAAEKGGPNAWGTQLNIPLPPGVGDEGMLYTVENWILPRLEEFKPDFIINSAGQDNHFTDPLASMNVTAQGYAKITELLKPDLAVLEGGYSIQGALPYVNLAIFLALAGEDYSGVVEPQKSRRKIIGGETFKSYLSDLRQEQESAAPNWTYASGDFLPGGKWICLENHIYYDTNCFQEFRKDYIRKCGHCGGTVFMISLNHMTAETGHLIRLPFGVCPQCRQAGYDVLEHLLKKDNLPAVRNILFQDQEDNEIRFWNSGKEVNLHAKKD